MFSVFLSSLGELEKPLKTFACGLCCSGLVWSLGFKTRRALIQRRVKGLEKNVCYNEPE